MRFQEIQAQNTLVLDVRNPGWVEYFCGSNSETKLAFPPNGSFLSSDGADALVDWLYFALLLLWYHVWSNNGNVASCINCNLTSATFHFPWHCQVVRSIQSSSFKNMSWGLGRRRSRALPRKPGYCPFP